MESDFVDIHFEKLVFFDNTSLLDDITYVDQLVADFSASPLLTRPDQLLQPAQDNQTFDFQIDILLVADYAMFKKFLAIYKNNTDMAYFALKEYLQAIFDQVIVLISITTTPATTIRISLGFNHIRRIKIFRR